MRHFGDITRSWRWWVCFFLPLSVKDHLLWELWFRQALSVFLGLVPTPGMIPSLRKRCPFFCFTMVFFHLALLEICKHKKGTRWSVSSQSADLHQMFIYVFMLSIYLSVYYLMLNWMAFIDFKYDFKSVNTFWASVHLWKYDKKHLSFHISSTNAGCILTNTTFTYTQT